MSLETVQATATTECPVVTLLPISLQEASGVVLPELRAYKLGKKRWSYNQVEITLCEEGGNKQLQVKEAAHAGASTRNPSGVSYELTLMNDEKLTLEAYLVYDCPKAVSIAPANGNGARTNVHEWTLVDRCACQRGCTGPVLRPIQRYGKLGKRSWNGTPTPDDRTKYNMKDTRYMYLSFDEAGTHVNQRTFRLVVSIAYDGGRHTTTGVSPPVRVLANNDVPTGAAHMHIMVNMPSSWAGWQTAMAPESLAARLVAAAMDTPQLIRTPHANRRMQSDGDDSNSDDEYRRGTPMRNPNYGPTAPSPYSTRRSTAAASGRPPLSPMGGASAPSSLLVDGSGTRMTPGVESASRPLEPSGGSLALWLGVAQELHDQGEKPPAPVNPAAPVPAHHSLATATAHVTLGSRSLDVKRPRTMGDVAAAGNLPHSVDFEPNFPAFLGPQTGVPSAYQRIHMMQGGAPGGHAVQAGHHGPNDDPIAAFVQLMMMQTPNPEAAAPIVELPAVSQGEHPGMNVNQYAAAMEKLMGAGNASPIHRTMMHNVPGTPPSFATPTPSALDELFGGVHATFDSIIQDDATYPPVRLPISPFASAEPGAISQHVGN